MAKSLMVIVTVAFGLAAASASASLRTCAYPYGHGPRNDRLMNVGNVSVRNMRCASALRALSDGWLRRSGDLSTSGFHCYLLRRYQSGGTVLGADARCVSGGRAFRFSWAT